jgi:hypothetical protein
LDIFSPPHMYFIVFFFCVFHSFFLTYFVLQYWYLTFNIDQFEVYFMSLIFSIKSIKSICWVLNFNSCLLKYFGVFFLFFFYFIELISHHYFKVLVLLNVITKSHTVFSLSLLISGHVILFLASK